MVLNTRVTFCADKLSCWALNHRTTRTKFYTLRESRRGGDELRTSVYPSNFAPIAAKLRQRAFQTICKFRFFDAEFFWGKKKSDFFFGFSSFSVDFRGARLFLTSKSSSSRFFASDGQIFRSVRRSELIFGFFTVHTSTCGEIWAPLESAQAANLATFWVLAGTHRKCQ